MSVQQEMQGFPVVVDLVAVMNDVVQGAQYSGKQKAHENENCARFAAIESPAQCQMFHIVARG